MLPLMPPVGSKATIVRGDRASCGRRELALKEAPDRRYDLSVGIDAIGDMARTSVNVLGGWLASVLEAASEGLGFSVAHCHDAEIAEA